MKEEHSQDPGLSLSPWQRGAAAGQAGKRGEERGCCWGSPGAGPPLRPPLLSPLGAIASVAPDPCRTVRPLQGVGVPSWRGRGTPFLCRWASPSLAGARELLCPTCAVALGTR